VLVAVLLDELETTEELATDATDELDFELELVVTEELDLMLELVFTLELESATDELDLILELDDFTLELDDLILEIDELDFMLDEEMPVPVVGIEHSFALLLGIGSDPKVATLQVKFPFNTL